MYAVFNLGVDCRGPKARAQGLVLMKFIDQCVKDIDDLNALHSGIEVLAVRHTNYGAHKSHFHVSHLALYIYSDALNNYLMSYLMKFFLLNSELVLKF